VSEALDYPEGATPPAPHWKWWNGLEAASPQRQPQLPTLIEFGQLRAFDTLDALAAMLAERLAGRRPVLKLSVASFDGFDSFPAFSIHAEATGAERAAAAVYVGCAAVQKTKAHELEAAIAAAGQQLGKVA
jgi:hypothetical protein